MNASNPAALERESLLGSPKSPTLTPSRRLAALDVFRGITLAGMILVNNPGSWENIYTPLEHAKWNGWTPTDLVFPSFLFIVGTAITLAFHKRKVQGENRGLLLLHAARRAVVLFVLGLLLTGVKINYVNGRGDEGVAHWLVIWPQVLAILSVGILWPDEGGIAREGGRRYAPRMILAAVVLLAALGIGWYSWADFRASNLRVPGVLQRIAVCYFLASVVVLYTGVVGRALCALACLVGYWAMVRYVQVPADFNPVLEGPGARLHEWIDIHLLSGHLYGHRPDPEGILSTLPAIATALMGVLAGDWLRGARLPSRKTIGLLLGGAAALGLGLVLDRWDPINKKIWTSAYVLFSGGFSLGMLAVCYFLVDVQGWRRWSVPFLILGTNTIAIYVLSGMAGWLLAIDWRVGGQEYNFKEWLGSWLLEHLHGLSAEGASLIFAGSFVIVWILLFAPLYRARLFIRI